MKNIKDYNLEDLKKELIELGEKPFRAEQIFKWIYEEKVKEFFKDNAIKRMLEEKKQKERMQQEAEAERQKKMETTAPIEYVFNEGERVFHDKLGIGHIKEVTQIGDSMMYTIDFGRQGIKAMDAAYAKLKKF